MTGTHDPLNPAHWNCTADELGNEIRQFIDEMGSFTPYYLVQIKFHLLKQSQLDQESFSEFCEVAIQNQLCPHCKLLYKAKECPLWYRLFKSVEPRILQRAPPCVRIAFKRHSIKTVVNYLVAAHLLRPPFYRGGRAPSCIAMRNWNYCVKDAYCRQMKSESTLEYSRIREMARMSGHSPRP